MKVIQPAIYSAYIPPQSQALAMFESAARTCYQSFDKQGEGTAERLLSFCLGSGHLSTIEHISASLRFITSRGVTHELVRHRLCAFSQESTRYVKYDGEMEFIQPYWYARADEDDQKNWISDMRYCMLAYRRMIKVGFSPQAARGVLPNDLKTEIVVTANLREWRHILTMRLDKPAHPDMRIVMQKAAVLLLDHLPAFFSDLEVIKKGYHLEEI